MLEADGIFTGKEGRENSTEGFYLVDDVAWLYIGLALVRDLLNAAVYSG